MTNKSTDKPRLPLPLPGDVDLSDLPYMPMHDQRLMKSKAWLLAKNFRGGGPGLGFCLFNLWAEAFRSVPAGSLDDDDDMLADKARCDIEFWSVIKDKALRGWERHGGRLWHPVICELAWDTWLQRLSGRHLKALDSHRAAAKRAMDNGRLPPDPPGGLVEWVADKYPATSAYQVAILVAAGGARPDDRPPDKIKGPLDFEPKRSEGKVIPPLIPPAVAVDKPETGKEGRTKADRQAWFAKELNRLENEFKFMLPVMLANMQRPGVTGKFGLVQAFKGGWLTRGPGGGAVIVLPSKQRADAVTAQHGDWMRHYWPDLTVRHAKVDELRARKIAA